MKCGIKRMPYHIRNLIKEAKFDFATDMPSPLFFGESTVVFTNEIPDTLSICNIVPTNQTHIKTIKINLNKHGNVYINVNRDKYNGRDGVRTLLGSKSPFLSSGNILTYSHIKLVFKMNK